MQDIELTPTPRHKRYKLYDKLSWNTDIEVTLHKSARIIAGEVADLLPWLKNKHQLEGWCFHLLKYGDLFLEDTKEGLRALHTPFTYIIITSAHKVIEYQQHKEGPDYNAVITYPIETATPEQLAEFNITRIRPSNMVHVRGLKTTLEGYFPYSRSLLDLLFNPELLTRDTLNQFVINFNDGLVMWKTRNGD